MKDVRSGVRSCLDTGMIPPRLVFLRPHGIFRPGDVVRYQDDAHRCGDWVLLPGFLCSLAEAGVIDVLGQEVAYAAA